MKDNSDIPLPIDQLRTRVLVFAIVDDIISQYQQITKGYVQISTDEDQNNKTFHYLQVKDQKTNEVLMRSNLKLQNNFGKQKGTIISWTDEQQPQYQQIALSFPKDRQCDMFWRNICQKIGKNYLQINGKDKLQIPSSENLNYILEKAKNNIDLVDYNIVHSKSVTQGLRDVFYQMKKQNDQMGMGIISRIINSIFSPSYSLNAIQTMLTGDNFYLVLDVQQFKKGINFRNIYDQKIGNLISNKFKLPKQIFEKIQISHRATFYRQNVLQLAQEAQLESIMFMICKQAQVQIISFLNRSKFFQNWKYKNQQQNKNHQMDNQQSQQLPVSQNQQISQQPLQPQSQNTCKRLNFIFQALIMYQHISSQQIKTTFKQNIYSSGILDFIKDQIQNNNLKAVQILFYICQIDKIKFFEYLVQDFKKNSTNNLLKTLMKKFLNEPQFKNSILSLIESFSSIFNLKKQCFDFFNGTFLCSIFSLAKDLNAVLYLINILLYQLQNVSSLISQVIKFKIFEKIVSQYRNGNGLKKKSQQLQIIKLLKHLLIQMNYKNHQKNKQVQKSIIDSGYLDICLMIYMKHSQKYNIISSSMLQNFKLIEKLPYCSLDAYLVKQSSQYQILTKFISQIIKKHIEHINSQKFNNTLDQYIQTQQLAHEQILQNQQQDQYLMKDQTDFKPQNYGMSTKQQDQNHVSTQTNDQIKKQSYIQYLKRIINEVKQDDQQLIENQPKKILKKSQQMTDQPIIELNFDLPDMSDMDLQSLG